MSDMQKWLDDQGYMPEEIRDFHDQKTLFKTIHEAYVGSESLSSVPNWTAGHIYTVDCFLFFMATRGYTLQKTRKKLPFKPMPNNTNPTPNRRG